MHDNTLYIMFARVGIRILNFSVKSEPRSTELLLMSTTWTPFIEISSLSLSLFCLGNRFPHLHNCHCCAVQFNASHHTRSVR